MDKMSHEIEAIVKVFTEIELHQGLFAGLNYISITDAYKMSGLFKEDDFYAEFSSDIALAYTPLLMKPAFNKRVPERSKRIERFLPKFVEVRALTRKNRSWITPGLDLIQPRWIARVFRDCLDRGLSDLESISISNKDSYSCLNTRISFESSEIFNLYKTISENENAFSVRMETDFVDFDILELFNSATHNYYQSPRGEVELEDDLICITSFSKCYIEHYTSSGA